MPVDGILIEGSELLMDESTITGESEMIQKVPVLELNNQGGNSTPFIISGSKVMDGSGHVLKKKIF
jgi:magnesium-transporting ATPase (P-type)